MEEKSIESVDDVTPARLDDAKAILDCVRVTTDSNSLYYQCFSLLQLAGLAAEIPRLVVLGQQSMGKTTLLDYLMGGPIGYSSTETGTKQPVVISIAPSNNGSTSCKLMGKEMNLAQLQNTISEKMAKAGNTISQTELLVEVFIPGSVHAIFVDLPGIKDDSKEGAKTTKTVVKNYVKNNPNDLYILVKNASDDPANWPWKLKEFIVEPAPHGLGLDRAQTIVVGTNAKRFLTTQKSDIKTQEQLLERVQRRTVTAHDRQSMKLFLLELFSLSVETKNLSFTERRNEMQKQLCEGRDDVSNLLEHFTAAPAEKRKELYGYFNDKLFKSELNTKFQALLNNQLKILEDRIRKRILKVVQDRKMKSSSLELLNPTSFMENIRAFVRLLTDIATELLNGMFPVARLENNGANFLHEFGGTLEDNLRDGHELAKQLFTPDQYDYKSIGRYMEEERTMYVRFIDNTDNLLGKLNLDEKKNGPFNNASGLEYEVLTHNDNYERTVPASKITEIVPFSSLATKLREKDVSIKCWQISPLDDDQITLASVNVTADFSQVTDDYADSDPNIGISVTPTQEQLEHPISRQSLFIDNEEFIRLTNERKTPDSKSSSSQFKTTSPSKKFPHFAKLLHKIALSDLSEWLKKKLMESSPYKKFTDEVALQMLRSVHLIQDKNSWEPLIADVLQCNVKSNMLNLSILVSCALAVHLRRVIKATWCQVHRRAEAGQMDHAFIRLVRNRILMDDLESGLENYCKNKALECVKLMKKDILSHTYTVRFDAISQFFSECCKYEDEFLNTSTMASVVNAVKKNLDEVPTFPEIHDGQLSVIADSQCQKILMQKVRMQYWVAKFILSQTLSTRAYVHFEKDLLDKTAHLGDDLEMLSANRTLLEKEIQQELFDSIAPGYSSEDITKEQKDKMLMDHYGMGQELENLKVEEAALGHVQKFLEFTLEAVTKLRGQTLTQNSVDFLIQLGDEASTGSSSQKDETLDDFSTSEISVHTSTEE